MLKKLFRLPLKRSAKPIKVGEYWVAKEESDNHKVIKKVLKVSDKTITVSSSRGFKGKVCINNFLTEFELHQELSGVKHTKKRQDIRFG